ncbi:MAG TPA: hypothetical protein VF517_10720 [Thermoleophilaceae bacterium]|jgi:hypothetical protein
MQTSGVLLCSIAMLVGAAVGAPAAGAQELDTGQVRDAGGQPHDFDRNDNFIVCFNHENGAVIDDRPDPETGFASCPRPFGLVPVFLPL